MKKSLSTLMGCTLAVLVLLAAVAPAAAAAEGQRPKIGLALSGGGARGAAHVGVLEVLESLRIPIDYIAGTSMGAVVGGLYAAGMSPAEIEQAMRDIDWTDVFKDDPPRPERRFRRKQDDLLYLIKFKPGVKEEEGEVSVAPALISGQKFDLELRKYTLPVANEKDFDRLRIPYRAVATDVVTGDAVILDSGDLAQAIRASMAIPAAFAPVEIGEKLLVDGGLAMNMPISVVRDMGADIVIAVDISGPRRTRREVTDALAMLDQVASLVTWRNTEIQLESLRENDILVVPDLGHRITAANFDKLIPAIEIGRAGAKSKVDKLSRLSLPEGEYLAYRAAHAPPASGLPVIDYVRVENQSRLADELITRRITIKPGESLDTDRIEADLARIHDQNNFESVRYRIEEQDGRTGLVVSTKEKSWGTSSIQTGLELSSSADEGSFFNLGSAYTRMPVNALNGEWRTLAQLGEEPLLVTELYQPLDPEERWFVNVGGGYRSRTVRLFSPASDNDAEVEYKVGGLQFTLAGGRNLGRWGRASLIYRRQDGEADRRVGDPARPEFDFETGELELALQADTLDNPLFPRRGWYGKLYGLTSRDDLGADTEYQQVGGSILRAGTQGQDTLIAGLRLNATVDDDAPIQSRFPLGGFLNLSGYNQRQLSGQHSALARVIYLRNQGTPLVDTYLGASLEMGNVWEDSSDVGLDDTELAGSIFAGVDTVLGPLYVGFGHAEGGHDAFYLFLGTPFSDMR